MEETKKSEIDYFLVGEQNLHTVERMYIDDGGKYSIDSDHCLMWLDINLNLRQHTPPAWERWNINDKTDWKQFTAYLENTISQKSQESTQKPENASSMVKILNSSLWEAGVATVGWICPSSRDQTTYSQQTNRIIKTRKDACRAWQRSVKLGAHKKDIKAKWIQSQEWKVRAKQGKELDHKQKAQKFMESIDKPGPNSVKQFWKYWKTDKTNQITLYTLTIMEVKLKGKKISPNSFNKNGKIYTYHMIPKKVNRACPPKWSNNLKEWISPNHSHWTN